MQLSWPSKEGGRRAWSQLASGAPTTAAPRLHKQRSGIPGFRVTHTLIRVIRVFDIFACAANRVRHPEKATPPAVFWCQVAFACVLTLHGPSCRTSVGKKRSTLFQVACCCCWCGPARPILSAGKPIESPCLAQGTFCLDMPNDEA